MFHPPEHWDAEGLDLKGTSTAPSNSPPIQSPNTEPTRAPRNRDSITGCCYNAPQPTFLWRYLNVNRSCTGEIVSDGPSMNLAQWHLGFVTLEDCCHCVTRFLPQPVKYIRITIHQTIREYNIISINSLNLLFWNVCLFLFNVLISLFNERFAAQDLCKHLWLAAVEVSDLRFYACWFNIFYIQKCFESYI